MSLREEAVATDINSGTVRPAADRIMTINNHIVRDDLRTYCTHLKHPRYLKLQTSNVTGPRRDVIKNALLADSLRANHICKQTAA